MSTSKHIYAVDLVKRESDRLLEMAPRNHGWARHAETLSGESDAPRRPKR